MTTVGAVQKRIKMIERFNVVIFHKNGKDVRDDAGGFKRYRFKRAADKCFTVREWKEKRFYLHYDHAKYDVQVRYFNGDEAPGKTMLSTVRETYPKE